MIASGTQRRAGARRPSAWTLLCAMVVLPLGATWAEDHRAVEKRLGRAVAEGELSLKHAAIMMEALEKASRGGHRKDGGAEHRFEHWIGSMGGKLKAAVREGRMSEQEAWDKWHHFKEHRLAPRVKAAVESGRLSEKAARKIWRGLEKAEEAEKLKAAVAKGEMTRKEAWAKWKQSRRKHHQHSWHGHREHHGCEKSKHSRKSGDEGEARENDAAAGSDRKGKATEEAHGAD